MPIIAALPQIFLALARSWPAILSLAGLVLSVGFSFNQALNDVTDSVQELWWIVALACLVVLIREYIKSYFDLKKKQAEVGVNHVDS